MGLARSTNRLLALTRLFTRDFRKLGQQADTNITIAGSSLTALGLLADFCTPLYPVLSYLFPIIAIIAIFQFWYWRSSASDINRKKLKSRARSSLRSSIAMLALLPIFLLNMLAFEENQAEELGFLSGQFKLVKEFQSGFLERVDRLDEALQVLNGKMDDNNSQLKKVSETTEKTQVKLDSLSKTAQQTAKEVSSTWLMMDQSVAYQRIDRAKDSRDGSNQGQQAAFEVLVEMGYDFKNEDLNGISFEGASLRQADFSGSKLTFADFNESVVDSTSFKGANMEFSNLSKAIANKSNFTSVYAPFITANNANFDEANLQGANFSGGNLVGIKFRDADLKGASFAFANLDGADFTGADLEGTYFIGANLANAKFDSALFESTNMHGVVLDSETLSKEQIDETCRHEEFDEGIQIKVLERWASNKYSSGYEFDELTEYEHYGPTLTLLSKALPICTLRKHSVNFDIRYAGAIDVRVERHYMKNANRRSKSLNYLDHHFNNLQKTYKKGPVYTGSDDFKEQIIKHMKAASQCKEAALDSSLDADGLLLWRLRQGEINTDNIDWKAAASMRLKIEIDNRGKYSRKPDFLKLNNFYPHDTALADLPEEASEYYKKWMLCRAGKTDSKLWYSALVYVYKNSFNGKSNQVTVSERSVSKRASLVARDYGLPLDISQSVSDSTFFVHDYRYGNSPFPDGQGLDVAIYVFDKPGNNISVKVSKRELKKILDNSAPPYEIHILVEVEITKSKILEGERFNTGIYYFESKGKMIYFDEKMVHPWLANKDIYGRPTKFKP